TAQSLIGFGLAAWLLLDHLSRSGANASANATANASGGLLLMVYWALNLPALGQEIAMLAQQYPSQRNVTLRLLEPLGAPEEGKEEKEGERERGREGEKQVSAPPSLHPSIPPSLHPSFSPGVALEFQNVCVRAGGHLILDNFDLRIEAGSH